jgi:hypothetical protein
MQTLKAQRRRLPGQYTKDIRSEKMARAYARVYDHHHGAGDSAYRQLPCGRGSALGLAARRGAVHHQSQPARRLRRRGCRPRSSWRTTATRPSIWPPGGIRVRVAALQRA